MALTDHFLYEPSIEIKKLFQKVPVALQMFPGEEVHGSNYEMHVVNFGGKSSINSLIKNKLYSSS